MELAEVMASKSSNEILSELFGAFNAEPPKIEMNTEEKSEETEENHSRHGKKSKKSKKSKKKHKSKYKKSRRRDVDSDSESGLAKKKCKKNKVSSPHSLNIELPVNKIPMALEIMLDGTVGIKGEDGIITEIPDVSESDGEDCGTETRDIVNGDCAVDGANEQIIEKAAGNAINNVESKAAEKKCKSEMKIPEVFETDNFPPGEKLKKGKIQIKDLKFSSVYQENVKAAEELKKIEKYEEGELTNTSEEEHEDKEPDTASANKSKKREHSRHKRDSKSRHSHRNDHSHSRKKREARSRSRSRSNHRSCSGRHSRDHSRSRDHSHYHSRKSSKSQGRSHHSSRRSRSNTRSTSRSLDQRKYRRRSRSKDLKRRSQSRSRERTKSIEKIDKEKLLAIARTNALKLIDAGVVPGAEKLTSIKAVGKTVNELTEYCKKISEKEAMGDDFSDIDSESSEDEEKPFHHPFQVKDRPNSIIMNIKNSIPLPVKSLQEKAAEQAKLLRLQFPVSSGSSHRRSENDWVPVSPPKKDGNPSHNTPVVSVPPPLMVPQMPPENHFPPFVPNSNPPMPFFMPSVPPPELPSRPAFPMMQPNPAVPKLDISSIVSKRLEAIRKLQENPNDPHALTQMHSAQQEMQYWAESKQETGAFTGSTGVKVLSPSELCQGAPAWVKKNQLANATPVGGGMGMTLLQKMGWQPGEGLGKNKEGTLEPLTLEIKTDKKGLVAPDESCKGKRGSNMQHRGPNASCVKSLEGKHPVSVLNELCSKKRYGIPQFDLCFECGPDHKKNFLFKVRVNGIDYTPTVASPNKKQAKAEAAAVCLRSLGIV